MFTVSHGIPIQILLSNAVLIIFFVSFNMISQIDDCNISHGFKTDHTAVSLQLTTVEEARGRGFWKFNTSLLNDTEYVNIVKQCIVNVTTTNHGTLNPNLLWDFLKCHIRSKTLEYSAVVSKKRKAVEATLVAKLNDLEQRYNLNPLDAMHSNGNQGLQSNSGRPHVTGENVRS